jgi:hypothetical protein
VKGRERIAVRGRGCEKCTRFPGWDRSQPLYGARAPGGEGEKTGDEGVGGDRWGRWAGEMGGGDGWVRGERNGIERKGRLSTSKLAKFSLNYWCR